MNKFVVIYLSLILKDDKFGKYLWIGLFRILWGKFVHIATQKAEQNDGVCSMEIREDDESKFHPLWTEGVYSICQNVNEIMKQEIYFHNGWVVQNNSLFLIIKKMWKIMMFWDSRVTINRLKTKFSVKESTLNVFE